MTGLKSGSGDDLWGDDGADDEEPEDEPTTEADAAAEAPAPDDEGEPTEPDEEPTVAGPSDDAEQPYIIRRAIEDKSVQFERDERLTFFVHDDVVDGERELLAAAEAALGRDVPKFDVREAVYRAALQNREDVIAELVKMGYSTDQ